MSRRRFGLALVCLALAGGLLVWLAHQPLGTGVPPRSLDAARLGPRPAQPVAGYLAGLAARLPPPGGAPVPALVQLGGQLDPADTVRLLSGVAVSEHRVVFRVPLPRVQTALRFAALPPADLPDPTERLTRRLDLARRTVQRAAQVEAGTLTGRQARLARYEAAVLAGPCRCVLAVLVVGDRAALTELATRPGVRAVDAAPEGTSPTGVALAPLLPEQTDLAGPTPDDGPVPAVPAAAPEARNPSRFGPGTPGRGISPNPVIPARQDRYSSG